MKRLLTLVLLLLPVTAAEARRPVVDLDQHPHRCVRLDRPVIYVGTPGAEQNCPAHVVGRQRAVLRLDTPPPPPRPRSAQARGAQGSVPFVKPRAGVAGDGLGFDACTAPPAATMAAWLGASPYSSIGVYIGGSNRGCTQANLTATWVQQQADAGWSFIPTYVGLQAPGSSCGDCAQISPGRAAAQGVLAADDAVASAAAVGFGTGTPLYYDMEHYARGTTSTRTVLTFMDAWTERLHSLGYLSGFYSSGSSGITDVVDAETMAFTPPDDLWVANWNNRATVEDPYLPGDRWMGKRIHQYRGGHQETWGGVTINIDNNVIDGDLGLPGEGVFPYAPPKPPPPCKVPKLVGKRLGKAKSLLVRRHCRVGYVRRQGRGRRIRVARQQYRAGNVLKANAKVGLTLRPRG